MFLLPIVERELRAASRRKSTYRVRVWTTLLALIVSFFFLASAGIFGRALGSRLGPTLFTLLTWFAFVMSLLAGVFFAADSISEEKREGTLGFLFLTDLKGYDVVLGKLAAIGLNLLYGLVAILPVIGLPLLMGGVTGAEYWRTALALVNALFFSMATGVFVSSWSRDAARAMAATLGLLIIAAILIPAVESGMRFFSAPAWLGHALLFNPYTPFARALDARTTTFWLALIRSQLAAWFLLLLASLILPRVWQDKQFRPRTRTPSQGQGSASFITRPILAAFRRPKLSDENPISWLAAGNHAMRSRAWWVVLITIGLIVAILSFDQGMPGVTVAGIVMFLTGWILKILFTYQAAGFFVEARKSGALELILSTPLKSREIVAGQWLALRRAFLVVIIVFLSTMLCVEVFRIVWTHHMFAAMRLNGARVRSSFGINPAGFFLGGFQILTPIYVAIRWISDVLALGWVGMWLGLSMKKPNMAAPATILFAGILPAMAICVPNPAVDLCLILWAREKLIREFRLAAMPHYHTIHLRPDLYPPMIIPKKN
jgi:ABC-type transport system involved in multi-copper enzyme maturation permease subunit